MTASNSTPSVLSNHLEYWLNTLLQSPQIADYCPNGLQVAGAPEIRRLLTGVTASQALLQTAINWRADAILVHHGWFWKNEDPRLIGTKRDRIALALAHNINIFGYHLPLDMHPVLGNNAQLASIMGWEPDRDANGNPLTCDADKLVWTGRCQPHQTLGELAQALARTLQREPLLIGNPEQTLERIAWCTGGAQSKMQDAINAGVQAFITGEASEPNFHQANETGVGFIAAGHHATERYGVKALGEAIADKFGIAVRFADLDNPI